MQNFGVKKRGPKALLSRILEVPSTFLSACPAKYAVVDWNRFKVLFGIVAFGFIAKPDWNAGLHLT